jgi:hypothetical protein
MKYAEKLKDPRWQQKRLRIFNRDGFQCKACQDTKKTLHVHHLSYSHSRDPWDTPDELLITLCFECHEEETEQRKASEDSLLWWLKRRGFLCFDLDEITNGLEYMENGRNNYEIACAMSWVLQDEKIQKHLYPGPDEEPNEVV